MSKVKKIHFKDEEVREEVVAVLRRKLDKQENGILCITYKEGDVSFQSGFDDAEKFMRFASEKNKENSFLRASLEKYATSIQEYNESSYRLQEIV